MVRISLPIGVVKGAQVRAYINLLFTHSPTRVEEFSRKPDIKSIPCLK